MADFTKDLDIITHLGDDYDRFFGAVIPPIVETSLFVYPKFEDLIDALQDERNKYVYTRGMNPTVEILEKKLAALEHGESCKCFGSGMGAISAAISTFTKSGDHILFINNVYGPTLKYAKYLERYNIEHSILVDASTEEIKAAVRPNTTLIYVESPGTMRFRLLDLEQVAAFAKERGILTAIDNTWATPIYQKPLDLGIDISIHSCTKYIGGHSDVVAGAVICSKALMDKIFEFEYMLRGSIIGPFEAWLLLRGLRSLPVRIERHYKSAMKIAKFLENHEKVRKVNYPALESHEDHEIFKRQFTGAAGLFSFELKTEDFEEIKGFINSLKLFKIGVSWGGFESLVISPNFGNNLESLKASNTYPGLVRISVGLEDVDSLIEDLEAGLRGVHVG